MAAPAPTVRSTPAGIPLRDGHSTKVTFAADPDVSLWEKTVQPPGVDGGDPIDTKTMFNVDWETFAARQLKKLTDVVFTAAYDPNCLNQLVELTNVETTITITFPDGTTWAAYGWLRTAEFDPNEEGTMPTGTFTITLSNTDSANDYVEAGPVVASVSGT